MSYYLVTLLKHFITKNIDQTYFSLSFKLMNNVIYGKCLKDLSRYSLFFTYCKSRRRFLRSMQNINLTSVTSLGKKKNHCSTQKTSLAREASNLCRVHDPWTCEVPCLRHLLQHFKKMYHESVNLVQYTMTPTVLS